MQIKRNFQSIPAFYLIFFALQIIAGLCFFVNELVGYFATLAVSTVFCIGLIFTADPFVGEPKPFLQWVLFFQVWLALIILVLGPVQSRELVNYGKRERWLLFFVVVCTLVSLTIIYLKVRSSENEVSRLFVPYGSQKVILIFIFIVIFSVMLHYNISYEAADYGLAARLDFEKNFITHLITLSACLAGICGSLVWQRLLTGTDILARMRNLLPSANTWLILLGIAAISCVAFAVLNRFLGGRFVRALSVPLNILYLAIPLGTAILSKKQFHTSGKYVLLFIGTGVLALAGAVYVDNGVASTLVCIFILATGCLCFTHQFYNGENNKKTATLRSATKLSSFLKTKNKPWLWLMLCISLFILVPLGVFVILDSNIGGKVFQQRVITMFYPAQSQKADFVTQMFATQVMMRDAVRYGGITGDGFWHNSFKLPQANSDMILGPTFFYFGLFGYCILLLIVALILQIGHMIIRKSLDGDGERALRFINFSFVLLLVIAIPALWLLGAISLKLPLTGVVFPFLARGTYFQGGLGVLLAFLVFFDRRSHTSQAAPHTHISRYRRLVDWLREPLALVRMIKWTMLGLGFLAFGYGYSFAALVHFPILAGQEGDKKYIVIPDNDTEEYQLNISAAGKGSPLPENGYRIGNTIVKTEIPAISEASYSDSFVYISEYSFNRDEAYQGITIGKSGQFSPILALPGLSLYAHKRNDIILFWEDLKELAHLTLKPENNKVRLSLGSSNADDKATAKVFVLIKKRDAKVDKDKDKKVGEGKWEEISKDEVLESDSLVKVGSTVMQIRLDKDAAQFLTIILEPDRPARASVLHSRQGEDFILSRTKRNIIGGLQLGVKNIEAARLSKTPWSSRFDNQIEQRATIYDRSGERLMRYDSSRGGAWYADANLFYTIGTSQPVEAGLDYILNPILSGKFNTNAFHSVLSTTNRSIHKEKVSGQNVVLSYDISIQRELTKTMESLLKNQRISSASAVILNGSNEILATAQYNPEAKQKFKFQEDSDGVFLRFDKDFLDVWKNINDRPLDPLLYANPLLRRPLCDAFKTELIGSTIKGILYTAALADEKARRHSHFHFDLSLNKSYVLGMEGDDVNTNSADNPKIFTAEQKLAPFGEYQFYPVHNSHQKVIKTDLYDAFRYSSNTTSCYLAMRLQKENRLEFALKRFMFDNQLLLQSQAFENRLNPSQYLKAEVTRYADDFNWNNSSDALRIGIGDKIYISLLHLATFYSTILVNEGMFIHPAIVNKIGEQNIAKEQYPILNSDEQEFVIPKMQELAQAVLRTGTGKAFERQLVNTGVEFIGGKTGTASLPGKGEQEHKIFVVCIKVKGKPFTIACRVNYAPTGTDLAVGLAARIVNNALLTMNAGN